MAQVGSYLTLPHFPDREFGETGSSVKSIKKHRRETYGWGRVVIVNRRFQNFPNLAGKNLAGENLAGENLSHANLVQANLAYANLTKANLKHTNLSGANLTGANLTMAEYEGANFTDANLKGVLGFSTYKGDRVILKGATMPDGTIHG